MKLKGCRSSISRNLCKSGRLLLGGSFLRPSIVSGPLHRSNGLSLNHLPRIVLVFVSFVGDNIGAAEVRRVAMGRRCVYLLRVCLRMWVGCCLSVDEVGRSAVAAVAALSSHGLDVFRCRCCVFDFKDRRPLPSSIRSGVAGIGIVRARTQRLARLALAWGRVVGKCGTVMSPGRRIQFDRDRIALQFFACSGCSC